MVHGPSLLALVNRESLQGITVVVKLSQDTAPSGSDQGTGSVAIVLWTDIEQVVKTLNWKLVKFSSIRNKQEASITLNSKLQFNQSRSETKTNSEYLSLRLSTVLPLKPASLPNAHFTLEILLGIHWIELWVLLNTPNSPFHIVWLIQLRYESHLRIDNIRRLWLILMYIPSWALVYHSLVLQDSSSPHHPVMLKQIMSLISLTLTLINDFELWPWVIKIIEWVHF